jgi:threonine dehydratase
MLGALLDYDLILQARDRTDGHVRPVAVALGHDEPGAGEIWLALEQLQHTGSFKARGAWNFLAAHVEAGELPAAGVAIASGGNAGLACAWAAGCQGIPATVFVPTTAPAVKVDRLRRLGAEVRSVGTEYAHAVVACADFVRASGALASHAYDHPLIAAGAGTLVDELRDRIPGLTTVVVAVGGGGLFAGVATAARRHGLHTVAVEPENCRALNAALERGELVDVTPDSVAADSLGARRASEAALELARGEGVTSLLVSDAEIIAMRQNLWDERRLVVEHAAATALAAVVALDGGGPKYLPRDGERIAVVLCGANTPLHDLQEL